MRDREEEVVLVHEALIALAEDMPTRCWKCGRQTSKVILEVSPMGLCLPCTPR